MQTAPRWRQGGKPRTDNSMARYVVLLEKGSPLLSITDCSTPSRDIRTPPNGPAAREDRAQSRFSSAGKRFLSDIPGSILLSLVSPSSPCTTRSLAHRTLSTQHCSRHIHSHDNPEMTRTLLCNMGKEGKTLHLLASMSYSLPSRESSSCNACYGRSPSARV